MDAARLILQDTFGYPSFRPLQEDIIRTILARQDVFVLMPTGGGKSLCYQVPALVLSGMTVVVSPLIALMKDQVDALQALGVAATFINSSLDSAEIQRRQAAVVRGDIKILYIAPERFAAQRFLRVLQHIDIAMFAIDEAHCISEWGHDFRPDYRELTRLREQFPGAIISAFTATATDRVQQDIRDQLRLNDAVNFKASFNRPNLFYDVRPKQRAYDQLTDYLRGHQRASGIIYCGSRATTEDIAARLRAGGYDAAAYHAGLESAERQTVQERFVRDDIRIIVATIAFGMGIDKPDVRFVIHYDLPKNLEGYYQESGRAGRDGDPSDCILFYSYGDVARQQYFINQRPTQALRDAAADQLRLMSNWAEERACRRVALLAHFGEDFSGQGEPCCDNCRNPADLVDFTIPVQMFLSCVKRTGERFGSAYVIDVLRGSKAERIERFGHHRLSTWGIGSDRPKHQWQYIAREIVKRGLAHQDPEQFNSIRISNAGYDVLFKGARVVLPAAPTEAATRESGRTVEESVAHPELFEAFRGLRKRLADQRGVPPYVVFPDSTLRAMAARLPRDERELRSISGVGERKARDFGSAFIAEVTAYVTRTGATPVEESAPARTALRSRPVGLRATSRHTLALYRDGMSPSEIAGERGLTVATVEEHLVEAIESGEITNIDRLVAPNRHSAIAQAIESPANEALRDIMDRLNGEFSYAEIKFVRAVMQSGNRRRSGEHR